MKDALGVLDLDMIGDLDDARRGLLRTARSHGLDLVDVMTFRPDGRGRVFRMVGSVHRFGAHAVVVRDIDHLHGFERAVTRVADLRTLVESHVYVGYGSGFARPSSVRRRR